MENLPGGYKVLGGLLLTAYPRWDMKWLPGKVTPETGSPPVYSQLPLADGTRVTPLPHPSEKKCWDRNQNLIGFSQQHLKPSLGASELWTQDLKVHARKCSWDANDLGNSPGDPFPTIWVSIIKFSKLSEKEFLWTSLKFYVRICLSLQRS